MPWLDPPEALDTPTRLPFRVEPVLIAVAGGSLLIGLLMFALGKGWINVAALHGGPLWLLSLFGLALFAAGVLLAARAAETAWLRRAASHRPFAWQRDYPWRLDGVLGDDRQRALVFDLLGLLALLPMLVLLQVPAWAEPALVPVFAWLVLGLLDLLFLAGIVGLLRRILGRARQGKVGVRLAQLPIQPGQPCRTRVLLPAAATQVTLELRGVSERVERTRNPPPNRLINARCFFRELLSVSPVTGSEIATEIAIPGNVPDTVLSTPPVTYWELVVRWNGHEALVLLPVYTAEASP